SRRVRDRARGRGNRRRRRPRDAGRTTGSTRTRAARTTGLRRTVRATRLLRSERSLRSISPRTVGWCLAAPTPTAPKRARRKSRVAALLGGPGLEPEPPQPHEPGGILVAEDVGGVVRRQPVVVQAVLAAPAGHLARTRFQVQAHVTGDEPLRLLQERVERMTQRREPQAVVHQLGVADLEPLLLAPQIALVRDRLQVAVGGDERQARGALIGLAALDADATVLDHVEPPPTVGTDDGADGLDELDEVRLLAVDADRDAGLETDHQVAWLRGRLLRERPDARRWCRPRVLHLAALDGSAPQVVVDGVELLLRRGDRDAVVGGVEDAVLTRHPPGPHWRDDVEVGCQRARRHLEAH